MHEINTLDSSIDFTHRKLSTLCHKNHWTLFLLCLTQKRVLVFYKIFDWHSMLYVRILCSMIKLYRQKPPFSDIIMDANEQNIAVKLDVAKKKKNNATLYSRLFKPFMWCDAMWCELIMLHIYVSETIVCESCNLMSIVLNRLMRYLMMVRMTMMMMILVMIYVNVCKKLMEMLSSQTLAFYITTCSSWIPKIRRFINSHYWFSIENGIFQSFTRASIVNSHFLIFVYIP